MMAGPISWTEDDLARSLLSWAREPRVEELLKEGLVVLNDAFRAQAMEPTAGMLFRPGAHREPKHVSMAAALCCDLGDPLGARQDFTLQSRVALRCMVVSVPSTLGAGTLVTVHATLIASVVYVKANGELLDSRKMGDGPWTVNLLSRGTDMTSPSIADITNWLTQVLGADVLAHLKEPLPKLMAGLADEVQDALAP